ncbi:MAG TPA: hypothetical protein VHB74_08910 [Devosia sp.]|nr:hypothetical protein [Devosia sp.]
MRIHIGGRILVADAERAPRGIDFRELLSGADRTFHLTEDDYELPEIDPTLWRPRRVARPIDQQAGGSDVAVVRIGTSAVLIDAPGEPALALLAGSEPPRFGRWANEAVVVLFGDGQGMVALGTVLLDVAEPKLLALAADGAAVEHAIAELGEHLDGTGLVSLEPGMAVEV